MNGGHSEILAKVQTLSNAIVFIDECESLFTRRAVLAEYGSVMAQSHKKLIANFIRWAAGVGDKEFCPAALGPLHGDKHQGGLGSCNQGPRQDEYRF